MIRVAGIEDVDIIVGMWKDFVQFHQDLHKARPLTESLELKPNASEIFRKYIVSKIPTDEFIIFLAEEKGIAAGYCLCCLKDQIPIYRVEKLGYLSDLYVKKEFRGTGISTKFKDKALSWFKTKGLSHTSIAVHDGNAHAHSIYRKWGFVDYHIELRKVL